MYPLTLETDHWPSTPPAARGSGANGDLFAMLLRRHADTEDTAAPRPRSDSARDEDPAAPAALAPRHRATESREGAAEVQDEQVAVDNSPAPTDAANRDDTGRQADAGDGSAAPDAVGDVGPAVDPTQSPADPATTPVAAATTVPTDPAAAPAPVATAPEISATPAATAPSASAAAPSDPASALPATPAVPATTPTAPSTDIAAPADAAAPTDTAAPAPTAPAPTAPAAAGTAAAPQTGELPAGKAAASLPAAPLPGDATAEPAATPTDAVADGEVQISRAPAPAAASTAAAQGLGKLGSGAEIALAAQSAGEAGRAAGIPSDSGGPARKPSAATTQQIPANAQGDGKPASGAPVAPASVPTGAAAQPQPPAGVQVAASFEAALNGAAGDTEIAPGGATGAGALQGSGLHGTAAASATPKAVAAAAAAPAEQLGVHIQRAVRDGNTRITVQLNPAELGQVEVHLDFARDGRVSATILADRADTLDMLQRDARLLERSLQDAGLQTGNGSLSFDLRDGGRQGFGQQSLARGNEGYDTTAKSDGRKAAAVEQAPPAPRGITDSGVDIHV